MVAKTITALCGRSKGKSRKTFTEKTKRQHERDCKECQKILAGMPKQEDLFPLTSMIGGDMPDGAFFALAEELGEWPPSD